MTQPPSRLLEHSFFFTPPERDRVMANDFEFHASLTTKLLFPLWRQISMWIPDSVAPNAISLLGAVFAVQAYQLVVRYYPVDSRATTFAAVALLLLSVVCSAVDGVHAVRCRSATPLGIIFSKVCSAMRHLFLALTLFAVLGIDSPEVKWYLIMSIQLIQLSNLFYVVDDVTANSPATPTARTGESKIVQSPKSSDKDKSQPPKTFKEAEESTGGQLHKGAKNFAYLFNTTEASLMEIALLLGHSVFASTPLAKPTATVASTIFYSCVGITLFTLLIMRSPKGLHKWPILLCLVARSIPVGVLPLWDSSDIGVIADGAMIGLLSIEVRVSAVAHRPLHSAVICIIVCSLGSAVFGLVSAVLYVVGMLTDLAYSTGTPLFVPVRNVYIDGVYDLCHIGHKRLMEYALSHGNRLIVGVMSDEECIKYKRKPIMTTEERCREVASCKWVSQVIPDCPPSGIPADFIKKYNIHIVVYGEEYEKPDDKYYAVPRAMGIGRIAPRTKGISTSEIIRRIASANQEELVAKDKASGASTVKE